MKPPKLTKAQTKKHLEPRTPKVARCFKCERAVDAAAKLDKDAHWEMPYPAVVFHDGGNFGSTLYDRAFDGIGVDLIVCDHCLLKHRSLIRVTKADKEPRHG